MDLRDAVLEAHAAWRALKVADRATWLVVPPPGGVVNGKMLFRWMGTYTATDRRAMACCLTRRDVAEVYLVPVRGRFARVDCFKLCALAVKAGLGADRDVQHVAPKDLAARLGGRTVYSMGKRLQVDMPAGGRLMLRAWRSAEDAALVGGLKDVRWAALRARREDEHEHLRF